MKKKAINKVFVVTSTLSLLATGNVFADETPATTQTPKADSAPKKRPTGKPTSVYANNSSGSSLSSGSDKSASTGSSANVKIEEEKKISDSLIKSARMSTECDINPEKATAFPLDFFKLITRDQTLPTFEVRDGNKVMVKFPPMVSIPACGKFMPDPYQDPTTKSVTIRLVNSLGKSYGEYLDCLYEKGAMNDKGQIVLDSDAVRNNLSEYSYVFDYSYDKSQDLQKTLKLSVGYPKAFSGKDGYSPVYGKDPAVELPSDKCIEAEKIASDVTYLNKGRDALLEEFKKNCNSGDAQRIAEARKSIGNAEALKDIADVLASKLDAAYLEAVKTDVAKIYEQLGKIEDEINKSKDMDEATARKKVAQYADLVKKLDEKFLNPAIYRLDNLMKKFAGMEDGEAKSKLGEEIKKLNEDISTFAKRNSVSFINLYGLMEKYALTDSAKIIEDIRLKSYLYSKVYPKGSENDKRGKSITFEEANQKQVKGVNNFERTLTDWTDVYSAGTGSMVAIRKTESIRNQVISKMNSRWNTYQQNEYKNYNSYCSVGMTGAQKNPIQCNAFLQGVEKRRKAELKKRDKDLAYVKTTDEKLSKMGVAYNKYQADQVDKATRDEDDAPYGSSYSGYETTFDEKFPQYDGPSTSTAYDASRYSMTGNTGMVASNSNGQGQQASFYPQQQQYSNMGMTGQYQYQNNGQYQYQMPQMQQQQQGFYPIIN